MRGLFVIAGICTVFAASAAAQGQTDQQRRARAAAAVTAANDGLRRLNMETAKDVDEDFYRQRRNDLMRSIHRAIDRLVEGVANHRTATQLEGDLLTVLHEDVPEREYGDPPSATAIDTVSGRSLLVTFNVGGPRHDSIPSVRAYVKGPDARYGLVASTGEEFERFTVRSKPLRSPLPGEGWLMIWGRAQTFNGTLIRFRVYAFDGEGWRTVWAPDDMLDAQVVISESGFQIRHEVRDQSPWQYVRDDYLLTPNGILHTGQRLVD